MHQEEHKDSVPENKSKINTESIEIEYESETIEDDNSESSTELY